MSESWRRTRRSSETRCPIPTIRQWDSDTINICGVWAVDSFGHIPVCRVHRDMLHKAAREHFRSDSRLRSELVSTMPEDEREQFRQLLNRRYVETRCSERDELVYLVERDGLVKIGFTTNLTKRLADLARGSCGAKGTTIGPVTLLATVHGGRQAERELHKQFASLRVDGEWFIYDGPLRSFVEKVRSRRAVTT